MFIHTYINAGFSSPISLDCWCCCPANKNLQFFFFFVFVAHKIFKTFIRKITKTLRTVSDRPNNNNRKKIKQNKTKKKQNFLEWNNALSSHLVDFYYYCYCSCCCFHFLFYCVYLLLFLFNKFLFFWLKEITISSVNSS